MSMGNRTFLLSVDLKGTPTLDPTNFLGETAGGIRLDYANNIYMSGEGPSSNNMSTLQFSARFCN